MCYKEENTKTKPLIPLRSEAEYQIRIRDLYNELKKSPKVVIRRSIKGAGFTAFIPGQITILLYDTEDYHTIEQKLLIGLAQLKASNEIESANAFMEKLFSEK